jgi:hypothetical protein
MTRSDKTKKLIRGSARAAVLAGLVGTLSAALAQDSPATRYAELLQDADITARYNTFIEGQLEGQLSEIASLEQQIVALDTVALDFPPMLQRMFDELEQFVAADVPFLQRERSERIARLRDIMNQVDTAPAEKYRRLVEAYQIEMEYGRTMDFYRDSLSDGRSAEFVRLGRVSLMYRADDGETGYWDNQQKTWIVDDQYDRAIERALRMAKEEEAADLIIVPVPAPQESRS